MMVRIGHVSISILMLACLHHSSVLHAPGSAHHTNCIVFLFQIEYMLAVASSYAMFRIAEPIVVAFLLVLH